MTTSTNDRTTTHFLILTAEDCHFCEQGKNTLHKLARDFPLEVEELSLESEQGRELAERFGVMFAPGLFLDGELVGFGRVSERKLRKLLQRRATSPAAVGG